MFQSLSAIGLTKHDVDVLAKALVPKENQSLCSQLNSLPTKNILFVKVSLHAPKNLLLVRVQTGWVGFQNKIRQT
jgi:hypothetical protein